jgi:NADH-quinone oxidoreductase subunit J
MTILFYSLAVITLVSAMGVIVARNPIYSALSLVLTLFSVAGFYLLLHAEFLAVIQVLTYAGAILVLFVFIIMLLNLKTEELVERGLSPLGKGALAVIGVALFTALGFIVHLPRLKEQDLPSGFGSVFFVGRELFTTYVIPFEAAGVLLTVALIGAVMLAKRDLGKKLK